MAPIPKRPRFPVLPEDERLLPGLFIQNVTRFPWNYSDEELKIAAAMQAAYEVAKRDFPIYHYSPNIAQAKLVYSRNDRGQMPRVLMLEGANKSGKSTLGVAWQISMAVGFFPWLHPEQVHVVKDKTGKKSYNHWHFDNGPNWKQNRMIVRHCGFRDYNELSDQMWNVKKLIPRWRPRNKNLAVGETYTESVDKDLVPKYMELIPKAWEPKPKKNQQGVIAKITLGNGPGKGAEFHFRSYKSSADEFEGIDISGSILFNEPPPQDIVTAVLRGAMPFDTRAMFAYTALKEPWIYRQYVNHASRWLI